MASRYANRILSLLFVAVAAILVVPATSYAQFGGGGGGGVGGGGVGGGGVGNTGGNSVFLGVVGGVIVDADNVVRGSHQSLPESMKREISEALVQGDSDLAKASELRVISLRGLERAIADSIESGKPLSAEVQYLAGLQRVEYVIVSPEKNDVFIAGPGEGWKVDRNGNVVGIQSEMPVVHLQDLLVAMRSVDFARQGKGISVSIDPTAEGVRNVNALGDHLRATRTSFVPSMKAKFEQAMGPQNVSLTGVPRDSHFSRVLLSADYKMKRLAMGLDPSPLRKLPSMMETIGKKGMRLTRAAPRMWMECSYEPVAKDESGNVWRISGQGVQTQTEESVFAADGSRKQTGKKLKVAEDWATKMTRNYEDLSKKEPVFRDLRNIMDLSVIAAIIRNEDLLTKVDLKLPVMTGEVLETPNYQVPETIPSELSFVNTGHSYVTQVSGGVLVDSWGVAQKTVVDAAMNQVATVAVTPTIDRWWWNAK